MKTGHTATYVAAALLASTTAFAQTTAPDTSTSKTTTAQKSESPASPVTLIGCVQKESDYRKEHNIKRGGGMNMGIGEGDEYVLINATRVSSGSAPASASGDCTSAGSGEAFEITGPQEEKFKSFVGKRVEVTGIQKKAEIAASGQPTGGSGIGADLKLFEVEVQSVKEPVAAVAQEQRTETPAPTPAPATTAPATTPAPETAPAPQTARETAPAPAPAATGTTGQTATEQPSARRRLSNTASPLALYELVSLLCFGGAYGVRKLRRN